MRDQNTGAFEQARSPDSDKTASENEAAERSPAIQMLRSQSYSVQAKTLKPNAPVQLDGASGAQSETEAVHQAASHGIQGGGGSMPHLGAIQQSFGSHDASSIQAHTGSAATQANEAMGAEAYATGNHVAFKGTPDLHTAAHEAAHVVQQRSGVSLPGGVGSVGDSYEQHADAVADAVVQGKSAEGLLNEMNSSGAPHVQQKAVQKTGGGSGGGAGGGSPGSGGADPAFVSKVDADASAIKGASDLNALESAVAGAQILVAPGSKAKVSTRISRLNNSHGRALPVWNRLPAASPGKSAVDAYWTDRMTMAQSKLSNAIASKVDPVVTAMKATGSQTADNQLKAEGIFGALMGATGYQLVLPETQADAATVASAGGICKCFDVGDLWEKMDATWQTRWQTSIGAADKGAAKTHYISQAKSQGGLPICPAGKEGDPVWASANAGALYKGALTGFVGMGKDAAGVASFGQAMTTFALNASWYPSGAMFIVSSSAATVQSQINLGQLQLGKPSIFNHLNFEEFLYAEHDQQFGELAQMMPDGKTPTESFNGVKELTCIGAPAEIWGSSRFVGP